MSRNIPEDIFTPASRNLNGSEKILIVTAENVEDLEFYYPYYRFIEAGFAVDVATPKGGAFKGKNGLPVKNSMPISDVRSDDYCLLYVPGGKAPEKLKKDDDALAIVRSFFENGKPICSVCHGPQLLAAAGVIDGHHISAWPGVENEVIDAGAIYSSQEALLDGQFITGRWPADLPALMARTFEYLESTNHIPERGAVHLRNVDYGSLI
jgi:protease I